jgi:hypothetical protein
MISGGLIPGVDDSVGEIVQKSVKDFTVGK